MNLPIPDAAIRFFTPSRLVMTVFLLHAVLMTNWYPRIPDVQAKLGVGPGDLSLGLLGMPIGNFIALLFAGPIVERFTPRRMIIVGYAIACAGMALPGWAWDVPSLFGALFIVGIALPVVDVAMNVEADRTERTIGRRIMSTCHGFWSVGTMVGGVTSAGFAAMAIEPRWHLLIVGVVCLPIMIAVARSLPPSVPQPAARGEHAPRLALPSVGLIGLCAFGFGMLFVESAALDWSGLYLREVVQTSPGATGFGFGAFALSMAVGRFLGDHLAERYGPASLARTCGAVALVGMIALVTATSLLQAVLGLAAAGFGVSVAVPLSVSAAAGRGDRPAAVNVAALSLVVFSGFLVEPPLIGFVSDAAGLRFGMATALPLIVVSLLLAGHLKLRKPTPTPVNPLAEIAP